MDITHAPLAPTEGTSALRRRHHEPHVIAALANIAELNLTIGASPSQAHVQAIADKVDELIAALVAGGLIAAP